MQFMQFSSKHDLFQHAEKQLEVVWRMKNVFHSFLNCRKKTRETCHRVEKPRALDDCHGFRDSGPIDNWLHFTLGIKISCNSSREKSLQLWNHEFDVISNRKCGRILCLKKSMKAAKAENERLMLLFVCARNDS